MDNSVSVLLVEDDPMIVSGLEFILKEEGYFVQICDSVDAARQAILAQSFDLAILDLSLPDGTGYTICQKLKECSETPVIFLTAVDDEGNMVKGLEMGADDYITKPFRVRELVARIKNVLKRSQQLKTATSTSEESRSSLRFQDIEILTRQAKVLKNGVEIILSPLEYRLLLTFVNHEGQILSRNQLLESLWDVGGNYVNDNTLTVYIKRLREKIGDTDESKGFIKTVRGFGYKLGD